MLNATFIVSKLHQAIVVSFLSLSSFTIASPTFAASLDFSTWDKSGDVFSNLTETKLTNAFTDGSDDADNYNLSGNDPTDISLLENFLALNPGKLGDDATEGSAIKTALNVLAGDVFSFDYSFSTYDTVSSDRAFATIGNLVFSLTGSTPFSYTFATSGIYNIGIGVIDVNDVVNSSTLSLTNASLTNPQSVPEPLTTLGSILAGSFGVMLKRRDSKKA
ncbi:MULTISPECIES: PEP-CTERM sorting domain-containing protein [Calothrix]|uniref:PEP-CTERM sorting domain-containing protein n=2 Tax=Calothrix TaxID=1186 RepID=A0ABR8AIC3_9CYAN|nr:MULTISPECIES: PEP-CTERM sorting domain-containing protein [Calothrix]MBD2199479.1 PEP-CTERM sorting domain-containing protein [Calothrix parietina FACHB-288]MBD2228141.1 PEP-CTERM sorting domain-containing protein [Calothrix anomala FACHB-343]